MPLLELMNSDVLAINLTDVTWPWWDTFMCTERVGGHHGENSHNHGKCLRTGKE